MRIFKNYFYLLATALPFLTQPVFSQKNTPEITRQAPFVLGETLEFCSEILGENRTLNLYLPPYYQLDTLKRYPVIYLLDGSADEDFIHIAGLVQYGAFSRVNLLPESIVVGRGFLSRPGNL